MFYPLKNASIALAVLSSVTSTIEADEADHLGSLAQSTFEQNLELDRFENGLRHKVQIVGENSTMNVLDRMAHYKIPGVSIALIDKGKIAWAKTYGKVSNNPTDAALHTRTLFQAGSISKTVTAFGALLLVQEGKISLDGDVNEYLKRWKVPENQFTSREKVTLRRLLSHTAGTTVSGFPGYSIQDSIPSLILPPDKF